MEKTDQASTRKETGGIKRGEDSMARRTGNEDDAVMEQ